MTRWVVLLRGVNVGGGNKLPMLAWRETLANSGFGGVVTYIQSGNAVVDSELDESGVIESVTAGLHDHHGLKVPVIVRGEKELSRVAEHHPFDDGQIEPKLLHVQFLDRPIAAADATSIPGDRFEPDRFSIDGRHIYLAYPNGSGRSKLTIEVFERAHKIAATARNLNTVRALAELANV